MTIIRAISASVIVLSLTGCVTRVEEPLTYTVPTDRQTAKAAIVERFVSLGYMIKADTEFSLRFEETTPMAAKILAPGARGIIYQIAVTGDKPATISPRIYAVVGTNPLTQSEMDITWREPDRIRFQQEIAPVIAQLGGR